METRSEKEEKEQELPKSNTQPNIKSHERLLKLRRSNSCPKDLITISRRGLTFFEAFDSVAESKKPIIEPHDYKTKLVEKVEQERSESVGPAIN